MPEWSYPETWGVGDELNADLLNRRVRDQTSLLLRKPMLVARMTAVQTIPNASGTALKWDTIDQDDDGLALDNTGGTYSDFYIQREGMYQFWLNIAMTGSGGGTAAPIWETQMFINGNTRRYDQQMSTTKTSGQTWYHSHTGTISLAQSETLTTRTYQDTGANVSLPGNASTNGVPRLVIMWLGIT